VTRERLAIQGTVPEAAATPRPPPDSLAPFARYACAAHELGIARTSFQKVPAAYQRSLEQKCQLEGLTVNPR
jgi:hypothetical protein